MGRFVMNRKKWIATGIGVAVLFVGVASLWLTGRLPIRRGEPETASSTEWVPDGEDSNREWIPEVSDAPSSTGSDEAARTDMKREQPPLEEAETLAAGPPVDLSPDLVQLLGVRTETLRKRLLTKTIRAVGRFDYNERTLAVVTSRIAGRIDRLFVNTVGERVQKGDPLLWIYSPELVSAQREHLIALRTDERARRLASTGLPNVTASPLADTTRQRLELWGLTKSQIADIETQGVSIYLPISAPIGGTVIQKNVLEGAYVAEGTPLFTIADLSSVWLYADVYESDMGWIRPGQEMRVQVPAYPHETFAGRIAFIDPIVDPRTRTTRVRAEFSNAGGKLKPGMYAQAEIRRPLGDLLAIPESAVIFSGKRNLVVVSLGNGRYQPKEVVVGPLAEGYYPAIRGLSEGEVVVTSANFLIDSESNLRTAIRKMSETGDAESTSPSDAMTEKREHSH